MRGRARKIGAVALALALALAAGPARGDDPEDPPPSDRLPGDLDCFGVSPEASVASLTDAGGDVSLATLVLVDRFDQPRARALMDRVAKEYASIGLRLALKYRSVSLSGTDSWALLHQARAHLADTKTTGFKLVHVLTGVDLTASDSNGVAGHAICIGGIRHAKYHLALSISEANYRDGRQSFGMTLSKEGAAFAAAHEIGHVLGARHDHGNCVENAEAAVPAREGAVCTVMDGWALLTQLRFGRVERAVVRGFALHYGRP